MSSYLRDSVCQRGHAELSNLLQAMLDDQNMTGISGVSFWLWLNCGWVVASACTTEGLMGLGETAGRSAATGATKAGLIGLPQRLGPS